MANSLSIDKQITILFKSLDRSASAGTLPDHGHLSYELTKVVEKSAKCGVNTLNVGPSLTSHFASAAVEMWLRGVHSFLISSSLTTVSPIWASVSGYYSSHYCVRGLAHLCGNFHLHRKKRIISINIDGGKHYCNIDTKQGGDREHKYYWRIVKEHPQFKDDPFFTINDEEKDVSDSGHRNIANYSDHLNGFPNFRPLDEESLRKRISHLSKIHLSSVPIPRKESYPDIECVQLIAYHRLIIFRNLLDSILGGTNSFWRVHRNPSWCAAYIDFQVTKPSFVDLYKSKV